jgi:hypothetical protein
VVPGSEKRKVIAPLSLKYAVTRPGAACHARRTGIFRHRREVKPRGSDDKQKLTARRLAPLDPAGLPRRQDGATDKQKVIIDS